MVCVYPFFQYVCSLWVEFSFSYNSNKTLLFEFSHVFGPGIQGFFSEFQGDSSHDSKGPMLYKTRQSLFIPRHSRTFKEHANPEYKVLIVEFVKIQFGLKIRGGGGGPPRPLPWIHHCNFSEG